MNKQICKNCPHFAKDFHFRNRKGDFCFVRLDTQLFRAGLPLKDLKHCSIFSKTNNTFEILSGHKYLVYYSDVYRIRNNVPGECVFKMEHEIIA